MSSSDVSTSFMPSTCLFRSLISIVGVIAGYVSWENAVLQLFLLFVGMIKINPILSLPHFLLFIDMEPYVIVIPTLLTILKHIIIQLYLDMHCLNNIYTPSNTPSQHVVHDQPCFNLGTAVQGHWRCVFPVRCDVADGT